MQPNFYYMEFSAQQISDFLNGTIIGDPKVVVNKFAAIESGEKGTLSFLSNPKYSSYIYSTQASIVLVNKDFSPTQEVSATLVLVENAYESLAVLMNLVEQHKPRKKGISSLSYVSSTAKIGNDVYVAPFVYIGENVTVGDDARIDAHCFIGDNVIVGEDTILHAGVRIENDCKVGNDCILHCGAVVGSDGFGFAPTSDGSYRKIPQMGNVVIEDNVEIGANTTIDRATLGSTIIRKGVKLDNLVQIAHNVEIKQNTAIAAQSGVAGSSTVGEGCIFAGQVGVAGHIEIADGVIFGAQAGVANSVKEPKSIFQGSPAIPVGNFRRSSIVYKNLPELQKTVYDLQKQIDELNKKIASIQK